MKRYPTLKEKVDDSIPNCEISSILDKTMLGDQLCPTLCHWHVNLLSHKKRKKKKAPIVTIVTSNTLSSVARQNSVASRVSPVHCFPFYSLLLFPGNILPSRPPLESIVRLLASLLFLLFPVPLPIHF